MNLTSNSYTKLCKHYKGGRCTHFIGRFINKECHCITIDHDGNHSLIGNFSAPMFCTYRSSIHNNCIHCDNKGICLLFSFPKDSEHWLLKLLYSQKKKCRWTGKNKNSIECKHYRFPFEALRFPSVTIDQAGTPVIKEVVFKY